MSANDERCERCKGPAETRDNVIGSSFRGFVQTEQVIADTRSVRVMGVYIRINDRPGDTRVYRTDERLPICGDCWSLLMEFLHGRSVPELAVTS